MQEKSDQECIASLGIIGTIFMDCKGIIATEKESGWSREVSLNLRQLVEETSTCLLNDVKQFEKEMKLSVMPKNNY